MPLENEESKKVQLKATIKLLLGLLLRTILFPIWFFAPLITRDFKVIGIWHAIRDDVLFIKFWYVIWYGFMTVWAIGLIIGWWVFFTSLKSFFDNSKRIG